MNTSNLEEQRDHDWRVRAIAAVSCKDPFEKGERITQVAEELLRRFKRDVIRPILKMLTDVVARNRFARLLADFTRSRVHDIAASKDSLRSEINKIVFMTAIYLDDHRILEGLRKSSPS